MAQKFIFTTLPWKNYQTNKLMLSAFISIKLEAGKKATLADFPDMLAWVEKLAKAKYAAQWNNGDLQEITLKKDQLDKDIYTQLFTPHIKVRTFEQLQVNQLMIKSYPIKHVLDFIQKTYTEVGNLKADTMPTQKFFTDDWKNLQEITEFKVTDTPVQKEVGRTKLGDFIQKDAGKRVAVKQQVQSSKFMAFDKTAKPSTDFAQVRYFHDRSANAIRTRLDKIDLPDFEYHDILSVLTSYPQLMRKFGLVLDFEIKNAPSAATGTVRIVPQDLALATSSEITSPLTAYQLTAKGFYAAPEPNSNIDKGVLKINTSDFTVVTVDTDGAALKLCNHIDALQNRKANFLFKTHVITAETNKLAVTTVAPYAMVNTQEKNTAVENMNQKNRFAKMQRINQPAPVTVERIKMRPLPLLELKSPDVEEGLPFMRTAGIGVAKNGHAEAIYKKLFRLDTFNTKISSATAAQQTITSFNPVLLNAKILLPKEEVMYADDLLQGYRMDIAYDDKPDKWYSLHKKLEEYQFAPVSGNTVMIDGITEDEGFMQTAVVEDENDKNSVHVNEVIARWEGWSLSVPKPGKGVNNPGDGGEVSSRKDEEKKYLLPNSVDFRLQVKTKSVKGSLPMLRFGKTYRVKIRTVDLAGNSLPANIAPENTTETIITGIKYQRYEPLPSPFLIQGNESRDGESVEHMVVRSNYNVASTDYESKNIAAGKQYPPHATRHIKAPRNSQQMAEMHGMFDAAFGSGNATAAKQMYDYIVSKDYEVKPEDLKPSNKNIIDGEKQNLELEYLADPMAAGVVFFVNNESQSINGWTPGVSRRFSFYFNDEVNDASSNTPYTIEQWKNPKSIRIRLMEGTQPAAWDNAKRLFTVYLPKGERAIVNYASFWRPDDVEKLSAMQKMIAAAPDVKTKIKTGRHWMFSPWRKITLVHAVQQPITTPEFTSLTPQRYYNETTALLDAELTLHGKSSTQVDIEASWTEFKDDLAELGPKQVPAAAHVATIHIAYDAVKLKNNQSQWPGQPAPKDATADDPLVQYFGDTKHRWVNYKPIATTRYREYFTALVAQAAKNKQEFPLSREGAVKKLNILSTARPIAPIVSYVIPSFNWIKNTKGNLTTHVRNGNIRVYLKRPWFSSGEGERLGVVLAPEGSSGADIMKHCTVWGKDPVFISGDLNGLNLPTKAAFPFAADYDSVYLQEDKTMRVDIAAYNVLYDEDRQLYFADIPIAINQAYFPFAKLALVRYQRDSVRTVRYDCCASSIVHADWLQLVPQRNTALQLDAQTNKFKVAISGLVAFKPQEGMAMTALNYKPRTKIEVTVENTMLPKTEEAFISINNRQVSTTIYTKVGEVTKDMIQGNNFLYAADIELPAQWKGKPYRVVVKEFELHPKDPLRFPNGDFGNANTIHFGERLVFMDVFEVNG